MPPQSPTPNPVMDVVAPPPAEKPAADAADSPTPVAAKAQPKAQVVTKQSPKPKQPGSGVGLAIFATVVIVLGLAGLATYAYLQTAS